ncbi:SIR2 family protein [Bradyrhizobium iriomotense]|uniref:SIR2 family protein n=1 Tax=Bradyrhizobium iriomotense TaxID=441950 RepID=UPI001B8A7B54|nr:SIR2 family protein [Bradyrhizobium iriomotense]MBR0785588.1 SIR2 family protein [Bradyrhizobium iriomotense]
MRFFADGPSIPETLIEDRDNGNVVFFCGAGISRPAGLPGFIELAEQVLEELGPPPEAKVREMVARAREEPDGAISLDQVFSLLQRDYGTDNVQEIVGKLLSPAPSASLDYHSTILRLSRNPARNLQIVTTNFDLLFERAESDIRRHVAPALPDLSSGQPLTGLVYLHGRLGSQPDSAEQLQLILSSSDFGRAYLADGWATRFVRDLLNNYVIVLLGYSANDPPVRYLLEGLHAKGTNNPARIFAFDQGTESEVLNRWRDRGVTALAYPKSPAHSALWDTLRAWADRSDDPEKWRRSVLDLASKSPRQLRAHERGQVVSLVRTTEGARLFAESAATPPAEWICVFDRNVRYAKPQQGYGEEETVDPLQLYGTDDDPPRPRSDRENDGRQVVDVLSSSFLEEQGRQNARLAGIHEFETTRLPPRLFFIARWFARVMDQPASVWWAGGYFSLHPGLISQIEWYLNQTDANRSSEANRLWSLLLYKFSNSPKSEHAQYQSTAKIKTRGWSTLLQFEFEESIRPFLASKRPFRSSSIPPADSWSELSDGAVVALDVKFPAQGVDDLEVAPEQLYRHFRAVRSGLECGAALLGALGARYWRTASFETDSRPGERYLGGSDRYLQWARRLFDKLTITDPIRAHADVLLWPQTEEYFFDKLKLHAWTKSLFIGKEVADGVLGLQELSFWNGYNRRELLHLLRSRWNDLPQASREEIERRIIAGSRPRSDEDPLAERKHRAGTAAGMLGWLSRNGCNLSEATLSHLPELRAQDPDWNDKWEVTADYSLDGRTGWVSVKDDPKSIIDLPISQVIAAAEQNSTRPSMEFAEYRPFEGLVKQKPQRALAALAFEARLGKFPIRHWQTALSEWPTSLPSRLQWLFAERLSRLPNEVIGKLAHYAPRWLKKALPQLASLDARRALRIWDSVLTGLTAGEPETLQSGLGETFVEGEPQGYSRRTYDHAINGPIGQMTEILYEILDDRKIGASAGIPTDIRSRIKVALNVAGEGRDHATCETTIRLAWLHYLDPNWVRDQIIPFFSLTHDLAQPAWNGFLHNQNLGVPELFALLKADFLELFEIFQDWRWDNQPIERLHEFLVIACYWNTNSNQYVEFAEARLALQRSSDDGRSEAISLLNSIIADQKAWHSFGKLFILKAWPRETVYQTPQTSRQFATIAENSGDDFPDVVRTISPLLVPTSQLDLFVYRAREREDESNGSASLPRRFPSDMVALLSRLIPEDPALAPYDLAGLVTTLAEASPALRQDAKWRRLNRIAHTR